MRDEVTVNNKYLFRLTNLDRQYQLLLIETDGGNERILSKTILSQELLSSSKITYYSKKLERVYIRSTKNDFLTGSSTMTFVEFSLNDGVASITGQAETTINNDHRQFFTRLRKIHFDEKNKLLRLLETGTGTAIVYTWKMDNLVLQSRLNILD